MRLADQKEAFSRLGVVVFALAAQPREKLEGLQADLGDAVTVLADPEAQAIAAFGMLDPDPFPKLRIARSGVFLIDRRGVLKEKWLPENYRDRTSPEDILEALR